MVLMVTIFTIVWDYGYLTTNPWSPYWFYAGSAIFGYQYTDYMLVESMILAGYISHIHNMLVLMELYAAYILHIPHIIPLRWDIKSDGWRIIYDGVTLAGYYVFIHFYPTNNRF